MELFKHIVFLSTICVSFTSAATCTLKPDTDPTRCGVKATILPDDLERYGAISVSKQSSKEDCASLCARRVNTKQKGYVFPSRPPYNPNYQCSTFFFDSKAGVCQLLTQNLAKMALDMNNTKSPEVFYQANCFDCGRSCPQPYYTELLDNGDFEDPGLGPWALETSRRASGRNSSSAYQCVGDQGYDECSLGQEFNACFQGFYMIKFDYLVTGHYLVNQGQLTSFFLSNFSSADVGKWRTATFFQKRLADHRYYGGGLLQFGFEEVANVTDKRGLKIDNVHASRIPYPPAVIDGTPNLVVNPGFESGELAPWTAESGSAEVTTPGLNGTQYALHCNCVISQDISTVADKAYLFQFTYRNTNKSNSINNYVRIYTQYSLNYNYIPAEGNLNTTLISFVADGPHTKIQIQTSTVGSEGIIAVDNVSVKEIDI